MMVKGIEANQVLVGEERIATYTVIWAAGVAASKLGGSLGVPLDGAGRVLVEADLTIQGHPEVFVIGDLATFLHQGGRPLPGLAPVAIQEGRAAAKNIWRACEGLPHQPFHYIDKGSLATIGRRAAVADLGYIRLSGFPAWLAWLLIHIFFLIGFRNRFIVLFEWAWVYFTYQRGARLITGEYRWPTPVLTDTATERSTTADGSATADTQADEVKQAGACAQAGPTPLGAEAGRPLERPPTLPLNYCAIGDGGVLGNHYDVIADVIICTVEIFYF